MSKTWSTVERATRGLGIAVTVGAVGAAITACALVSQGARFDDGIERDADGRRIVETNVRQGDARPSYAPRADVLAYGHMSDVWAATERLEQEETCARWLGLGGAWRDPAALYAAQNAIVAHYAGTEWHTATVRQFLAETCETLPMVGEPESRERKPEVGPSGITRDKVKPEGQVGPATQLRR